MVRTIGGKPETRKDLMENEVPLKDSEPEIFELENNAHFHKSGVVSQTLNDGSKRVTHPDGTEITTKPDGTEVTVKPDGSKTVIRNQKTSYEFADSQSNTVLANASNITGTTPAIDRFAESAKTAVAKPATSYNSEEICNQVKKALANRVSQLSSQFASGSFAFEIAIEYQNGKPFAIDIQSERLTPEQRQQILTIVRRVVNTFPVDTDQPYFDINLKIIR